MGAFLTRKQKEALIAQKRAEIAAKLAAMRSGSNTAHASPAAHTPVPTHTPSPGPSAASAHFAEDVGKRIAEAKRKVSEAQNKLATKDNPYMVFRFFPLPKAICVLNSSCRRYPRLPTGRVVS